MKVGLRKNLLQSHGPLPFVDWTILFKSLLVLSGNTKKEGIKSYVTEADLILNSIKDLYKILKKKIDPDSPL